MYIYQQWAAILKQTVMVVSENHAKLKPVKCTVVGKEECSILTSSYQVSEMNCIYEMHNCISLIRLLSSETLCFLRYYLLADT